MALALGVALALSFAEPLVEVDGLVAALALKLVLFAAYPVALFVFGFVLPAERAQLQRLVRGLLKGRRVVTSVS
jgi:hypothetical protein